MYFVTGPIVRAVSQTCATIWVEVSQAAEVTLQAYEAADPTQTYIVRQSTLSVGGHFYAAPQLPALAPFTLYTYKLIITTQDNPQAKSTRESDMYSFRTLPARRPLPTDAVIQTGSVPEEAIFRIAYGSCRKLEQPEKDTLSAYGDWLQQHEAERESVWPQILMLLGDQIYADEPPIEVRQSAFPAGQEVASTFADFAVLYQHAWTNTAGIKYMLAHLPTFTIFDDHEITNSWNLFPGWRIEALHHGQEQMLVDGMVAYWVYQGWGNLLPENEDRQPLLEITRQAQQNGTDALELLRACIREEVYGRAVLPWHYIIPTTPTIFVSNARAERSASFSSNQDDYCTSTRIMSQGQMLHLQTWLSSHAKQPAVLVSSVPVLLPPLIGLAEYIMGIRPFQESRWSFLRKIGLELARKQLALAKRISFDHWPVFSETWRELLQVLLKRPADMLVLSGDVHFSYAAVARPLWKGQSFRLYQFVCSPFENELSRGSRSEIQWQSFLARSIYAGLASRVLPLRKRKAGAQITRRHLLQRAIAVVTIQEKNEESYSIAQEYLGFVEDTFSVIASTTI